MNIEELRNYCLEKKKLTESFPFDTSTLVFKVANKMFAVCGLDRLPHTVNVKCNPETSVVLRENYTAVTPAYHMNKKHWNSIVLNEDMSTKDLKKWIDHSYELVTSSFTKKKQKELGLD